MDEFVTMGSFQSNPTSVRDYTPDGDDELQSSGDEFSTLSLTETHRHLPISRGTTTSFGKSSGVALVQTVVEMRKGFHNHNGSGPGSNSEEAHPEHCFPSHRRRKFWQLEPVNLSLSQCPKDNHR